MSTVNFAVSFGNSPPVPADTVVTDIEVNVTQPDGTSIQVPIAVIADAVSANVALTVTQVGAYSANVGAFDQHGNLIGQPATVSFSVAAPATIVVQIPASIVVTSIDPS